MIPAEARLAVRLTPRAGRDAIDGVGPDGRLRVQVRAIPSDGAANEALRRVVAETLGLPRSSVRLVAGATGRQKTLALDGVSEEVLAARWPGLGAPRGR
jgi:uncharacterized protein YggU (UPF0235/DUF167 family)